MVKIYIQNKPLFLVDRLDKESENFLQHPDTLFQDKLTTSTVKTMLDKMGQPPYLAGIFVHPNLPELLAAFKTQLNVVVAAGGLVRTNKNELLLIHRLGMWDLPKGKLEPGESLEACAVREIEEETGARGLVVEKPLTVTYHTYHQKGKDNLKESHWFLLKTAEKSNLTPQTEEDVQQCIWVPAAGLQPYIDGAFASIADVLKKGLETLQNEVR